MPKNRSLRLQKKNQNQMDKNNFEQAKKIVEIQHRLKHVEQAVEDMDLNLILYLKEQKLDEELVERMEEAFVAFKQRAKELVKMKRIELDKKFFDL